MKRSTSIISLFLVLAMIFSLSACSGKVGETPSSPNTDSTGAPSTSGSDLSSELAQETVPWYRGEMNVYRSSETGFQKKTPEGTVVYATSGQIIGCDPMNSQEEYCWSHNVYEGLLTKNLETGELEGLLATDWGYDEEGNLHITLREGVKFHDGTTLDTEDVLFTLQRNANSPESKVGEACRKIDFEKSYSEDALNLVLVMKEPSGSLLYALSSGWLGIMSKEFCEQVGDDYDFMEADAGTGAYTVVETVTGASQTFERFEDYWGGVPEIETVIYKLYKDYTPMFIDYQNGDLDFCLNNNYDSVTRFFNGEVTDTVMYQVPVNRGQILSMTTVNDSPLSDVRLRQALAHCIDYDALLAGVYQGPEMASVSTSMFIGGVKYRIDAGRYEYDPNLSKELLAQAGYDENNRLSLTLETSDNVNNIAAAEMVQYYASEVGIDIEVISEKSTAMTAAMNSTTYNYDIILMPITYGSGHPEETLAGRNAFGKEPGTYPYNRAVQDEAVCALMTEGSGCIDEERAAEIYAEIQEMYYDQCWLIPLLTSTSCAFGHSYLENTQFLSGYGVRWADWTIAN